MLPTQDQFKAHMCQAQCFAHGWYVNQVKSVRLCEGLLLKPKQILSTAGLEDGRIFP